MVTDGTPDSPAVSHIHNVGDMSIRSNFIGYLLKTFITNELIPNGSKFFRTDTPLTYFGTHLPYSFLRLIHCNIRK